MLTKISPTQHTYLGLNAKGFHKLVYYAWGQKTNPVFIMVHGLSRNGRDFDVLAEALSENYYVICPDMVGRGKSDWLPLGVPYSYPQYMADLNALINHLNCDSVYWLGTSMGGILGMLLASLLNTPIKSLIINDVGPFLDKSIISDIQKYVSIMPTFKSLEACENFIRQIYASFGNLTPPQWQHLTFHSVVQDADMTYRLHYDPRIVEWPKDSLVHMNLWEQWNRITCPIYVLRGESSQLLTMDILKAMKETKPHMTYNIIKNAGHAPALMSDDEINLIKRYLLN